MGLCNTKHNKNDAYRDFCKLRISTLFADLDESINKKKKIIGIVEYFMDKYFEYNIDVLCIQGIYGINIIKDLINAFKKKINEYNNNVIGNKNIYLEFYPDIEVQQNNSFYMSTCEDYKDNKYCNKLIVSRHSFLQTSNIEICCKDNILYRSPKTKINDSDDNISIRKYMQLVNINVDGTIVSVYNVELEPDSTGISNIKERKIQLNNIINNVKNNKNNLLDANMRKFTYGDVTYIASNRDIHIVTGMFHINEIKNNVLNQEYINMNKIINGLDINRWIKCLRNDNNNIVSNIKLTKDVYTFLISDDICDIHDISLKSQKIFEKHNAVIVSSNIMKNSINMNKFTYYPEDTVIMIYKPRIIISKKTDINATNKFIQNIHNENNNNENINNESMNINKKNVCFNIYENMNINKKNVCFNNYENTNINKKNVCFDDKLFDNYESNNKMYDIINSFIINEINNNDNSEIINETINETINNETIDNMTIDEKINETINDETINNMTINDETINNMTIDDRTIDNMTIDDRTIDNMTIDDITIENMTIDNRTIDNIIINETINDRTINNNEILFSSDDEANDEIIKIIEIYNKKIDFVSI